MQESSSKKRFALSLSAKFIFFAVLMEILLISGGFYTAYTFLTEQRVRQVQTMLSSQVNLLSKELELEKELAPNFQFKQLELNSDASFQVVDFEGRVFWDLRNAQRIQNQISAEHPLFDLAKNGPDYKKNILFQGIQTDIPFFGAYKKVLGNYIVMGAVSKKEVHRDTFFILEKLIYLTCLFCGVAFLMIVFFSNRIIKPIRKLTFAAKQISAGHFDLELDPPSNDEIGVLSSSFSSMAQRIRVLLQEEFQKVRIKEEVNSVAHLQQSLLPKPHLKNSRYEIQSYYQSAAETGGDYWGYFEGEKHLVLYIADATGHGLPSAMLTVAARGCFSALHRLMGQRPDFIPVPSKFLAYANDAILDSAQEELNMTMFVAVYSYEDHTLTYANAGHNPAWLIRDENGQRRIEVLKGSGVRLGESKDYHPPEDQVVAMHPKDAVFLYTDGLLDCENEHQEQYGKNRVKDLLVELMQKHSDLESVRNSLVNDFTSFLQNQAIADDITFTLVEPR